METNTQNMTVSPPRLIPSIISGFNTVASNIQLIILPVLLDLILWFAPHLRLKTLAEPLITNMLNPLADLNSQDITNLAQVAREQWQIILEHFNLVTALHTLPVGIPSLLVSELPLNTPMGQALIFEMSSFTAGFGWLVLLSLAGIIAGSLYFYNLARFSSEKAIQPFALNDLSWESLQIIILSIILVVFIIIGAIPLSLMLSLFFFISPLLAEIALLVLSFIILWVFLPLVFTPHGIYLRKHNILISLLVSARLVRSNFPITVLFLTVAVLINQGLNILWHLPPDTSWLKLVGIAGHAFISTGLIAASFIYYRDGLKWIEAIQKRFVPQPDLDLKK